MAKNENIDTVSNRRILSNCVIRGRNMHTFLPLIYITRFSPSVQRFHVSNMFQNIKVVNEMHRKKYLNNQSTNAIYIILVPMVCYIHSKYQTISVGLDQ